jgi:hypothetical protein
VENDKCEIKKSAILILFIKIAEIDVLANKEDYDPKYLRKF